MAETESIGEIEHVAVEKGVVIVTIVTRLKYPGQCGDVVVWGSHLLGLSYPKSTAGTLLWQPQS